VIDTSLISSHYTPKLIISNLLLVTFRGIIFQLLDILVKNCGYPLHLQISTKEFLNELVRRFPEKPPVFPPPPMQKILELIHEWKLTICVTSKHKEDLVHIRDMHRLLSYKGKQFPKKKRTININSIPRLQESPAWSLIHPSNTHPGYRFPDVDRRAAQVLNESDVGALFSSHDLVFSIFYHQNDFFGLLKFTETQIRRGT
jgi:hypothetical protein